MQDYVSPGILDTVQILNPVHRNRHWFFSSTQSVIFSDPSF